MLDDHDGALGADETLAVWKVRPAPNRAIRCTFLPISSVRPNRTDPVAGASPVIASTSVVLPAPLGPIRNRRSPWRTVIETPSTATKPSNTTRTLDSFK